MIHRLIWRSLSHYRTVQLFTQQAGELTMETTQHNSGPLMKTEELEQCSSRQEVV